MSETKMKSPRFSAEIMKIMREKRINPLQLSKRIDGSSYDHIRRVVKGESFSGLEILTMILKALDISDRLEEFKQYILLDKATLKGYTGAKLNKDNHFMVLNDLWNDITEDDKVAIVNLATKFRNEAIANQRSYGTH